MEDPVVGGYTPEKVALRRAISLGADVEREIRIVRRGQAHRRRSRRCCRTPPATTPNFKSEMGDYNPARAKALLDLYGYVDRDGDGWREQPDGKPLVLEIATQPDQTDPPVRRAVDKNMEAIGMQVKFRAGQWPEQLKAGARRQADDVAAGLVGRGAGRPEALSRLYWPAERRRRTWRASRTAEFDRSTNA